MSKFIRQIDRMCDRLCGNNLPAFVALFSVVLLELLALAFAATQNQGNGPQDNELKYYGNLKGTRVVEMFAGECHVFTDGDAAWLNKTRGDKIASLNPIQFELLLEKCQRNRVSHHGNEHGDTGDPNHNMMPFFPNLNPMTHSGNVSQSAENRTESPIVFPGTKWCGRGDVARNYDDLGVYAHTDSCCRDHDNCFDNIPAGGEKHGLRNNASFTSSHCDCDDNFLNCLRSDSTLSKLTSAKIAHIYFNILKPLCFAERHPVTACQRQRLTGECIRPEYDYRQGREWQFFQAQPYFAKTVRGLLDTFSNVFGPTEATVHDPASQSGRRSAAMPHGFTF